jgi:hypothetical protein
MSKENPEFQLIGSINLTATISCSKCDAEEEQDCNDLDEAMQCFYYEGWRATENFTYCKKCAKKYLKSKKRK